MKHPYPAALCLLLSLAVTTAAASTVKITPLGSHSGEFCPLDRALVLEDPDGTRLLYDPGRTVRGAEDPRLGRIDAVLLSHAHGDHLGDAHQAEAEAGSCAKPDFSVQAAPVSNAVRIVVAKEARFIVGGEMASFFARKVAAAGGKAEQVQLLRFGAQQQVGGVSVASVPAVHSNGLSPDFLDGEHAELLADQGLTAYLGPPGGFVLRFSNGLTVYLSGDTGITAEQDLVVGRHYRPQLAVINIGDTYTTGPREAAYVINELVRPAAVIPSHANEVATEQGELLPDTRTAAFRDATRVPVHLPLSGRSMEFDARGRCTGGC